VPGPHGDIRVRVYTPSRDDATSPLPAVTYLHGGGWVFMGIETHDTICRRLTAASGCVVVSVDYRLAPEHPFPIPLDDCYAAVSWVAQHPHELGTEPGLVAVMGDSAGGNLAAGVTLAARERGGPRLAAQVLVYPALDPARDTPQNSIRCATRARPTRPGSPKPVSWHGATVSPGCCTASWACLPCSPKPTTP
jgi:acetyl esterase